MRGELTPGKLKAIIQRIRMIYKDANPEFPGMKHPEVGISEELRYIYGEGIQNQIDQDILNSGLLDKLEMVFNSPEVLEEIKCVYREILTEWLQEHG